MFFLIKHQLNDLNFSFFIKSLKFRQNCLILAEIINEMFNMVA